MTALKPYPAYKDSGVEWLGEVPEHWEVRRLKTLSQIRYGLGRPPREAPDGLPLIRATNVSRGQIIEDDMVYVDPTDVPAGRNAFLSEGEIVVVRSGAYTADSAIIPKRYSGAVTGYDMVVTVTGALPEFVAFAVLATYIRDDQLTVASLRAAQPHLNAEELGSALALVPNPREQSAIAHFLDDADRRIRRYIRAKERLIDLLEEQKHASIQQAVTGRIDVRTGKRYPAYKASGVEWMGEIPEHWGVVALRHLATKFGSGITPRGGATIYETKGIPFLRSQNVHFDGLRLEGVARIPREVHMKMKGTHVKPGDVLLNITGASIGRVCAVSDDLEEANVNQHVCIIRLQPERVLPEFAAAFLSTREMQEAIELEQVGASRQGLTLDSVRSFKLFVPTVDEQRRIVAEVQAERDRLGALACATERQIGLAREYRTRLIADVVTGKIDVREAAARLPEVDPIARHNRVDATHTESHSHATEHDMAKEAIP